MTRKVSPARGDRGGQPARRREVRQLVERERRRGGMAVVNALLERPDAAALVRALGPAELHELTLEVGLSDSADLVALASGEQWSGLFQLDAWTGSGLRPERVEMLFAVATSAGAECADRLLEAMEPEEVGLYLLKRGRVVQRPMDPEQDEQVRAAGECVLTPDNMFYLVLHEASAFAAVSAVVRRLYARDADEARSLLLHLAFEDADSLEESAARTRSATVRSLGFPTVREAEALLRYVNPQVMKARVRERLSKCRRLPVEGEPSLLPALLGVPEREPPFLRQVLEAGGELEAAAHEAFVYIANAMIVAVADGDLLRVEARGRGVNRALALSSLGLEHLSDGDVGVGREVLSRVHPKALFRCGHSLALGVRERGRKLFAAAGVGQGFYLFDPPLDDVVRGAAQAVPQYFEGLKGDEEPGFRDFASLKEIARTQRVLDQAEGVVELIGRTLRPDLAELARVIPADLKPAVTHTTLMATALVNALLARDKVLSPLSPRDVHAVRAVDFDAQVKAAVQRFLEREKSPFVAALFDLALTRLQHALSRVSPDVLPSPQAMAGALLVV